MLKVDIQELAKTLRKYENGELGTMGKRYLKDDLLLLSKELYDEGVQEGDLFESMSIIIKKDCPFPQLHRPMIYKDANTGEDLEITIHEILSLQKNINGDISIEALVS